MATAQSLSAEAQEPVGSFSKIHNRLPAPPTLVCLTESCCQDKHSLMKNKYNACQTHYLAGGKSLREFKLVIHVTHKAPSWTIVDITEAG